MANGNPFYVEPGNQFGPGLAGLAQSVQFFGEQRAKTKAKERFENAKAGALEAFKSRDPDRIAKYMIEYPEMAQVMDKAMSWKDKETKKNFVSSGYEILKNPTLDTVEKVTSKRQQLLASKGVPPEMTQETDRFLEEWKRDPEAARKNLEHSIATYDPEGWEAFQKIYRGGGEQTKAIPTDIDDFVVDADAESVRLTGKKLTPGQRNKARLQFKRAQAREVHANRFAQRNVEAATASKIKYNEGIGKALAEIETAGELIEAKGEVSPQAKIDKAKIRMGGNLATLANHYITLDSTGAMLNVDNTTSQNIIAAIRSSMVGQQFGRITGTNEQSIRSSIKKLKPLIIQDIRQSTDMGSRGLDSEKELEFYLQAATDEKTDIQSNLAAIVVLDEAFGNGQVASKLRNLTDKSIIKRISDKGKMILSGGEAKKIEKQTPEQQRIILRPPGVPDDAPTITTQEQYDELRRKHGVGYWYFDPETQQWEQTQ